MVNPKETWYILKGSDGRCDIVPMLPDSTEGIVRQAGLYRLLGAFCFPTRGDRQASRTDSS